MTVGRPASGASGPSAGSDEGPPAGSDGDPTRPLLVMRGICKAFPGVQALDHARLELDPAEVHVLLGENGAGKSTLMKVLCGQLAADAGSIELAGQPLTLTSPQQAERCGLVMIHQELSVIEQLTVAENIFLGREPHRWGVLDRTTMQRRARHLLDRLGADAIDVRARVADLSIAQRQLVEIARALRAEARILVMDEPTAPLADREIATLFDVIRGLCATGTAVVYISHRMQEIFAIGRRVTVMRDGAYVATHALSEIDSDQLIEQMVGRPLARRIVKRAVELGPPLLRVEDLALWPGAAPLSLAVRSGEVLGVAGLMGSGRSSLLRAIFGADIADRGDVFVGDRRVPHGDPASAVAAGIGLVTEDRKLLGLLLGRPLRENVSLAALDRLSRGGFVGAERERRLVARMVERLAIRAASVEQPVGELSGGNQQKSIIARWLAARCRVLLLDEPTRGIDVGAKAAIYELIGDLVAEGVAIVLVSSELEELLGLADRIAVMHEGALQTVLERAIADQATIMRHALGRARDRED